MKSLILMLALINPSLSHGKMNYYICKVWHKSAYVGELPVMAENISGVKIREGLSRMYGYEPNEISVTQCLRSDLLNLKGT